MTIGLPFKSLFMYICILICIHVYIYIAIFTISNDHRADF